MLWEHPSLQAWMPLEGQNRTPANSPFRTGFCPGVHSGQQLCVSRLGTQNLLSSLLFYRISLPQLP